MIVYVDSSVLVTLIKREGSSNSVIEYLDDLAEDGHPLVAGHLVETELRRVANRLDLDQSSVPPVLERVNLVDQTPADFRQAGILQARLLGTLDALHLATAIRTRATAMLTFDEQLAAASEAVGIPVLDLFSPRTMVSGRHGRISP